MKYLDINVSISLSEAEKHINNAIINSRLQGVLIDRIVINETNDSVCVINVFEKHYLRIGKKLTLTVIYDNMNKFTRIHAVCGGMKQGILSCDFGASGNFTSSVFHGLENYLI